VPETVRYRVPGMHCGHCEAAVKEELAEVEGVEAVDVDLDSKVVTVRGTRLSDDSLRAAIEAAGYDAA
jgi:copper chaperone